MGNIKKLRINVLSPVRFHVFYLARELAKAGFDIRFYTRMPLFMARKYGMPKSACRSIFWLLAPLILLERRFKIRIISELIISIQDLIMSSYMRKCDVCIATSGGFSETIVKAKKRKTVVIVHRGSKHIIEQRKILDANPTSKGESKITERMINRELKDYSNADYLVIQTNHVKESFLKHGFPREKLYVIPTGVDIDEFKPSFETEKVFDLIMVGNWCYRKGCDLIEKAVKTCGLKLLHVGNVGDLLFPQSKLFTHIDAVEQSKLPSYYNQAKVFILPSREEGLAMVQMQAIACNLPLIGSSDSGAEDLKEMVTDSQYIIIIKDYTVDSVIEAIKTSLLSYERLGNQLYAGDALRNLTWEAYGKRYASFLESQILS